LGIALATIVDAAGRDPLTKITQLPYLNNVFTQLYTVLPTGIATSSITIENSPAIKVAR